MANVKIAYAADAQLTITLASLASDSNLLAGRESTAVDNSSNLYTDYLLSGKITVGTSPTAGTRIEIWVAAPINDTPTWPDTLDGTDSDETITSTATKHSALRMAHVISVDSTTSDRTYPFTQVSVASLFGGKCPTRFVVFVVHNTGVNLNSTGSNHEISVQGVYATVS